MDEILITSHFHLEKKKNHNTSVLYRAQQALHHPVQESKIHVKFAVSASMPNTGRTKTQYESKHIYLFK